MARLDGGWYSRERGESGDAEGRGDATPRRDMRSMSAALCATARDTRAVQWSGTDAASVTAATRVSRAAGARDPESVAVGSRRWRAPA
jgi:hypothetical protein